MSNLMYPVNINFGMSGEGSEVVNSTIEKSNDSKANPPTHDPKVLEAAKATEDIANDKKAPSDEEATKEVIADAAMKKAEDDAKKKADDDAKQKAADDAEVKKEEAEIKKKAQADAEAAQLALQASAIRDDSEIDSIDGDGIENFRGIEGEEVVRSIKDITSGDKFRYWTVEELELQKLKQLHKRKQSNPPEGPIGTIFQRDGKWLQKCIVHARVSMEVDYLIDINKEMKNYVRPGGPYKLRRYACVDEGVPVCADYADWYYDPELRYVKDYDIRGYRKRRIQRWLSQACPIHEDERFDRYLVRCHSEAIKELTLLNQEYKSYQFKFPHIVDQWVSILHLGMLFKRKNMGKFNNVEESELIIKLLREECELLYFKTKVIFYEEPDDKRDLNIRPKQPWILHPRNLCGDGPI